MALADLSDIQVMYIQYVSIKTDQIYKHYLQGELP